MSHGNKRSEKRIGKQGKNRKKEKKEGEPNRYAANRDKKKGEYDVKRKRSGDNGEGRRRREKEKEELYVYRYVLGCYWETTIIGYFVNFSSCKYQTRNTTPLLVHF